MVLTLLKINAEINSKNLTCNLNRFRYFMATGWVVQESSGVYNNQPVLLRVDYTQKDNQGYIVYLT